MSAPIPVLIVGAGPTGLSLALVLQQYQIPFRLIDARPEPTQTSNALAIHAGTLKVLDQLGLAERFLTEGYPIYASRLYSPAGLMAELNFRQTHQNKPNRYPFVLALPQSRTEALLEAALIARGGKVERGLRFENLIEDGKHVEVVLENERCLAEYVVAADGYHSQVRAQIPSLNNEFVTRDLEQAFILADIDGEYALAETLAAHTLYAFYSATGILGIFPLGHNHYRLIADVARDDNLPKTPEAIFDKFKTLIKVRSQNQLALQNNPRGLVWASHFWIHSACLPTLRHDRLFFCGDAAHVHSPVGGQGMNLGIQDAFNLGFKLAFYLTGRAKPSILTSYNSERLPIAKNTVKMTEGLTQFLLKHPLQKQLLQKATQWLLKIPFIQHRLIAQIMMLSLRYKHSNNIDYHCDNLIPWHGIKPGALIPELPFQSDRLQLLIFTTDNIRLNDWSLLNEALERCDTEFKTLVDCVIISPMTIEARALQIHDADKSLARRFGVKTMSWYLVRPDRIVACYRQGAQFDALFHYLHIHYNSLTVSAHRR
jgi:2-polyprenyl-6-methoxyphenol hydroxylase-like FAD-dependent oxidoreductase